MNNDFLRSKALFQIVIIICSTFYFVVMLESLNVRATDICCEKSGNAYCQSFGALFPGDVDNCNQDFQYAFSKCEKTDFCKVGCCIKDNGCYPNVGKAACLGEKGVYNSNAQCSFPQCEKHCCQVGKEYFMATFDQCKSAILSYPDIKLSEAFDTSISSEAECVNKYMLSERGCCVSGDTCKWGTGEGCIEITGNLNNFNKDVYCSGIEKCGCDAKKNKGCVDYDTNLYWFDSCDNPEDVAEKCDYNEGFVCGELNGENTCKNINCLTTYMPPEGTNLHDENMGGLRKNGESWCVYDSGVGGGYDRPGSRHYRHLCINGEEFVEVCRDFREEICVQGSIEILESGSFTESVCIPNTGEEGGNVPLLDVPLGSMFWEGENEGQCAFDQEISCTIFYKREKGLLSGWGDWECEKNCECELERGLNKEEAKKWGFDNPICPGWSGKEYCLNWVDSFADVCVKRGDCGAHVNIADVKSIEGFKVILEKGGWKGTGKTGPEGDLVKELNIVAEPIWAVWNDYGLLGAMKELGELLFDRVGPDTDVNWFGPVATIGGITAAYITIYSWISTKTLVYLFFKDFFVKDLILKKLFTTMVGLGWLFVIFTIITLLLKYKEIEIKDYTISLECLPWKAPSDEQKCNFYNDNEYKEIGEYTCRSLGKNCMVINEGTEQAKCEYIEERDFNSPMISSWKEVFTEGYEPVKEQLNVGFGLNKMVEPFMPITIGIKTDEYSQCMMDTRPGVMYDQMILPFGDFTFKKEHNITFRALPIDEGYTYYIRCADYWGNTNMKDYVINFKVDKGPDLTAPIIELMNPGNNAYVKYGDNSQRVILLLNEPSQCKWGLVQNIPYSGIVNGFTCANDIGYSVNGQYGCMTNLTIVPESKNTYYIRCEDLNGNQNQQDYTYSLIGSEPLQVLDVQPTGQVYAAKFTLTAATNSLATCTYNGDLFFSTGGTTHTQELNPPLGSRTYLVECIDSAGNTATKQVIIMKMIDDMGPRIMRMYFENGYLHIESNEDSTCEYSNEEFSFGSGVNMPVDKTIQHTTTSILNIYYVMCADDYGNIGELAVIHP